MASIHLKGWDLNFGVKEGSGSKVASPFLVKSEHEIAFLKVYLMPW